MDGNARKFLEALVSSFGPSGFEGPVVRTWLDYAKDFADEVYTDAYGNGFAVLNPKGDPHVVLTGHADEIGLMVSYIDDEGFLWVSSIGGYDAKILPSMRVRVLSTKEGLPGVIGSLPPHMQRASAGGTELQRYQFGINIYVDIGAGSKAEAEKHVRVGDPIVLDYGLEELQNDLVCGRALDNRIGIWSAIEALRRVAQSGKPPTARITAIAAVQEEIGCMGAGMAAFREDPDLAIAVDVTQSVDHPMAEKKRWGDMRVGLGPVLAHGSACHPELTKRIESVARHRRIPLQHEAAPKHTGTDADSIFRTRSGIPTAVVSLAQRYMHSPAETVDLRDLDQIAELLAAVCLGLKKGERFSVKV